MAIYNSDARQAMHVLVTASISNLHGGESSMYIETLKTLNSVVFVARSEVIDALLHDLIDFEGGELNANL